MKPAAIAMLAGSLLLAIAVLTKSWLTAGKGGFSVSAGLLQAEFCEERDGCQSRFFLGSELMDHAKAKDKAAAVDGLITVVAGLATVAFSIACGVVLLTQNRRRFALLVVGLAAGTMLGALIWIGLLDKPPELSWGYSFILFWLGVLGALAGGIMAIVNKGAVAMAGPPGMYPGAPEMYPGGYGQPPMQPSGQVQAGPACPACSTPATWVAQYNRWFCTRCNQYL